MESHAPERELTDRRINVLVVDDSTVARMLLVHVLESDPRIRVIGTAGDGQAALAFVAQDRPDVILMDIHMPVMDGFEAARRIMETLPVPIVVCTATAAPEELITTFRVMEAGAVAAVEKPVGREHPGFDQAAENIRQTVKLMSEVRVVRRWARERWAPAPPPPSLGPGRVPSVKCIGIGASTGGPQAFQELLASLPKTFPVPILVVQHIARGFLPGLAEWLRQTTGAGVQIGAHGVPLMPGRVYLAPDDFHIGVSRSGRIVLTREEPQNHLRPAVAYLFRSLADVYGPSAVGVLLSGMGRDGAAELKLLKDLGAVTIVQDRDSSVVYGMAGEAVALGAAMHVLPPDRMAGALCALAARRNESRDASPGDTVS